MLEIAKKEKTTSMPAQKLISSKLTLSRLVKITEGSLVDVVNKLVKNTNPYNSPKETISFLNLSNQGLSLTTENLDSIKDILTDIGNKSKIEANQTNPIKRIVDNIDQINLQSSLFNEAISKYIEHNPDYQSYKMLSKEPEVNYLKDFSLDKIPLETWHKVYANTLQQKNSYREELRFFLVSISRIINYSKKLIDLVRKEINNIKTHIQHYLKNLFNSERSTISNQMDEIKLMIMQKSKKNLLSQVKRMNPKTIFLVYG